MSEPARWTQEELDAHMMRFAGDTPDPQAKPAKKRPSVPRSRTMNKVEAAYDAYLAALQKTGCIGSRRFESVTLLLADGCRYTPDFMVCHWASPSDPPIEFHEVKGTRKRKSGRVGPHIEDDARVKLLTAAKLYPEFPFKLCWPDKGKWQIEDIAQ